MSKRPRNRAHLLTTRELLKRSGLKPAAVSAEATAAAALERERQRRAQTCFQEVIALLDRYGCTFQVITQEIQIAGQAGVDRRTQVNVLALDNPPEAPAPAPAPSSENGSKPAA